jgi:hypothetical protein
VIVEYASQASRQSGLSPKAGLILGGIVITVVFGLFTLTQGHTPLEPGKAEESGSQRGSTEKQQREDLSRREAEEVARSFPSRKPGLLAEIDGIKKLVGDGNIGLASVKRSALRNELDGLRHSSAAATPDFAEVTAAFDATRGLFVAYDAAEDAKLAKINAGRDAYEKADARSDLSVVKSSWRTDGFDTVAVWNVTIRNSNKSVAYVDFGYTTHYTGESGTTLHESAGVITQILKPGQTRTFEVNDGFVRSQTTRASFQLIGARKRMP